MDPMTATKALLHIHARLEAEGLSAVAHTLRDLVSEIEADPIRSADLFSVVWRTMQAHPAHRDTILDIAKEV